MALTVPEKYRLAYHPAYGQMDASLGNNGVFILPIAPVAQSSAPEWEVSTLPFRYLYCIVSNGGGWEHVSVTLRKVDRITSKPEEFAQAQVPTHEMMCLVKSVFWGDEDTVMHLYPPKSEYVNNHAFCLHLWRPSPESGLEIPRPPSLMVGLTDKQVEGLSHHARMTLDSLRRDREEKSYGGMVQPVKRLPIPPKMNNILRGKK